MTETQEKTPARARRPGLSGSQRLGGDLYKQSTTPAPVRAFRNELFIILNAAHRMAAGYGVSWDDYDRIHEAHQHVIKVLEVLHEQ